MTRMLHVPFFVLLLPLVRLFALFADNFDELLLQQLFVPTIYILSFVVLTWVVIRTFFVRDWARAAFVISFSVFLFRPFTSIQMFAGRMDPYQYVRSQAWYYLLFIGCIFFLIIVVQKISFSFKRFAILLNIFAFSFFVIPAGRIIIAHIQRITRPIQVSHGLQYVTPLVNDTPLPDIYYIIVDRYANQHTLASQYNFDNSPFLQFLDERGFYVATQSAANYPFTPTSLASSLNMIYLDDIASQAGKISIDKQPLFEMVRNNEVVRYLKAKGYTFYNLGAGWDATDSSPQAHENYQFQSMSKTAAAEYLGGLANDPRNSLATFVEEHMKDTAIDLLSGERTHGALQVGQFLALSDTVHKQSPKFVFVHSLMTHDPYVFDENGNYNFSLEWNTPVGAKPLYISQLTFANKMLTHLIQTIQSDPENQSIIILQSDEGPYPKRFREEGFWLDWKTVPPDDVKEKMRNLSAYYLPGSGTSGLYPTISPVNSFRFIFNQYFGERLPLLPDKHYLQAYYETPYDLFDVTDVVKYVE